MHAFDVLNGELLIGGVPLRRLAERVGQTPFYAYDRQLVSDRIAALRQAMPAGVHLLYAVKANPMAALLGHVAPQVDGMDVASAGELQAALNAGVPADRICFAGPGKQEVELRQAVAAGVLLHIESFREIHLLRSIQDELKLPARVALRVNPDFEIRSAGMRMGGGAQSFGVDVEQAPDALDAIARAGLSFEGFHVYAGSQVLQASWLAQSLSHAAEMLLRLTPHLPGPVRSVNLGGGWGIPYFDKDVPLNVSEVAQALASVQARLCAHWPQATLVQELGRYIVGEAGVYVSRVLDRKRSRGEDFLILDGGMHHHLAATGNLGQIIRRPYPMAIGHKMNLPHEERLHVVGPLCTPLDALGHAVQLPHAEVGDLLVVFQSGAYGATASPQRFLSHPACVEVLV